MLKKVQSKQKHALRIIFNESKTFQNFFLCQGFLSQILTIHRKGKRQDNLLFHSTTCNFATLHVRWLSHIFNRNACIYQTVTWWDLSPYWIPISLIDWWCNVCVFTWWIDSRFLLQQFHMGNRWIWTRITREVTNQVC